MAFVSKDCIDKWFREDSWVYKGFAYLFRNPLWTVKRMPQGFSLCPYFWMAVFSLCLFKPFIVPTILLLKFIVRKIIWRGGAPLTLWDNFIRRKIGVEEGKDIGLGLVLTMLSIVALILFTGICISIYRGVINLYAANPEYITLLIWAVLNSICVLTTGIYTRIVHGNSYSWAVGKRCKVEWYSLTFFIISTIVACMFAGDQYIIAITAMWTCMKVAVIVVVGCILWLFHGLIFTVCPGIWFGLKWFGVHAWKVIVPVVIYGGVICVFGAAVMWIVSITEKRMSKNMDDTIKIDREDWIKLMVECLMHGYNFDGSYTWDMINKMDEHLLQGKISSISGDPEDWHTVYKKYEIIDHLSYIYRCVLSSNLISFPPKLMNLKYNEFSSIRTKVYGSMNKKNNGKQLSILMEAIREATIKHDPSPVINGVHKIQCQLETLIISENCGQIKSLLQGKKHKETDTVMFLDKFLDILNRVDQEIDTQISIRAERREQKHAAKIKRDELCQKVSTPISDFWTSVCKWVVLIFWTNSIVKLGKGIWFVLCQIGTFMMYMWEVVHHLKQGACPYRTFTSVDEPK